MTALEDTRRARAVLACLFEPGNRSLHALIADNGAVEALDAIESGLADSTLVDTARARVDRADGIARLADTIHTKTQRLDARIVIPEDPQWPSQLSQLSLISHERGTRIERDTYPPLCLWVRGRPGLEDTLARSVAVVGARAATPHGTHAATEFAYGLADAGWAVVSGGAFGIDAAAHRGALAARGVTAAVLACGVDRPYPAGNAALFERIADQGLLLSEWPPGADPHRYRFLVRNRVIAALTRGTVLVEANARSGARHTLGRAAALHRPIMAMPGPISSAMSVGAHQAIRSGARLVTNVAEILEEIGRVGDDLAPHTSGERRPHDRIHPDLVRVLDAVPTHGGAHAEHIAAEAGVCLRDAMRALPQLEAAGLVHHTDSGWTARPQRHAGT